MGSELIDKSPGAKVANGSESIVKPPGGNVAKESVNIVEPLDARLAFSPEIFSFGNSQPTTVALELFWGDWIGAPKIEAPGANVAADDSSGVTDSGVPIRVESSVRSSLGEFIAVQSIGEKGLPAQNFQARTGFVPIILPIRSTVGRPFGGFSFYLATIGFLEPQIVKGPNSVNDSYLFTSESVSMGHPDKVADQISDAILDHCLATDPMSRVACETMVTTDLAIVAGEITTTADLSRVTVDKVVRDTIRKIGYTDPKIGFAADTCQVMCHIHSQSPDIAVGVDSGGAGDQGMMFGFACNETKSLMPLPIYLSHRLVENHAKLRENGELPWIRPDAKSQVTVEYNSDGTPLRIHTVVLSTQHDKSAMVNHGGKHLFSDQARMVLLEKLILPTLRAERPDLVDGKGDHYVVPVGDNAENSKGKLSFHINPTGIFLEGGPHGDCGLTGRKIIVDTYGGRGRHGGGAFSGKDPTKVDRSAAYMSRYIAKNVVAAGLADQCEVQVSYAIGYPEPINIWVSTFNTAKGGLTESQIAELVRKHFKLTPKGIIETLNLRRPIYRETARHGHFGRDNPEFLWESTEKALELKKAAGI